MSLADTLVGWAGGYPPDRADAELAQRSLLDTLAVTLAARDHPIRAVADTLPDAARWSVLGHVLDFDDLHIASTTHISAVIVPAVLAAGGGENAYLAGAGVMARLGTLLGWPHYSAGWHATCTAGAPAAAVAAGVAWGLTARQLATALALAVPAAGGVQAAFGTQAKSLQVGFAAQAGVRAAHLARLGASADPRALDEWFALVAGQPGRASAAAPAVAASPAVPGGLAIKLFPCCYAMQRPIAALREVREKIDDAIDQVVVTTPRATVQPLIHDRPHTGLEGKFSMPYAIAAAVLDDYPGFGSFSDEAVNRVAAQRIMAAVETDYGPGGAGLLDGKVDISVRLVSGREVRIELTLPPGSPERPPDPTDLDRKLTACGPDVPALLSGVTWSSAAALLRAELPGTPDRAADLAR